MSQRTSRAMLRLVRPLVGLGAVWLLVLAADGAAAFVPQAERVARAIADTNRATGRSRALRFEVEMRLGSGGEGPLAARGELVTHPTGMARLELWGARELVEKHILLGSVHQASRNGESLSSDRAREFLPPLFLLQIDSAVSLSAALHEFRIHPDWVGLAPCDENDCFVIGDPERVPSRPLAPAGPEEEREREAAEAESPGGAGEAGSELVSLSEAEILSADGANDSAGARASQDRDATTWVQPGDALGSALADAAAGGASDLLEGADAALAVDPSNPFALAPGERHATLWVDMESFDVRRMRLAGGVRVTFGPYVQFERIRVPSWFEIEEERGSVRFDVTGVTPVNAPASAFDTLWLLAPSTGVFEQPDESENSRDPESPEGTPEPR